MLQSKRSKVQWNRKRLFFFNIMQTAHLACSVRHRHKPVRWLQNPPLKLNSYWMFWINGLSWRFSASSFCDFFEKLLFVIHHIFSFLTKATLWLIWLILMWWILVSMANLYVWSHFHYCTHMIYWKKKRFIIHMFIISSGW